MFNETLTQEQFESMEKKELINNLTRKEIKSLLLDMLQNCDKNNLDEIMETLINNMTSKEQSKSLLELSDLESKNYEWALQYNGIVEQLS